MADEVLGRETSGLFNAGLTPCSHTTTTEVRITYYLFGDIYSLSVIRSCSNGFYNNLQFVLVMF